MKKCDYNVLVYYRGKKVTPVEIPAPNGSIALDQIKQGRDIDVMTEDGRLIMRRQHIGYIAYALACEETEAPTDANCKEG